MNWISCKDTKGNKNIWDLSFLWQQYEVRWQCVRSGGSYSSCWYSSWTTRVVNSTYTYVNVSRYGTAYEFEITIITSHGRGLPRKLSHFVQPLNGMPRDFSCKVAADSVVLTCYWSPPTDFNPAGFNVSSNERNYVKIGLFIRGKIRRKLSRIKRAFRLK